MSIFPAWTQLSWINTVRLSRKTDSIWPKFEGKNLSSHLIRENYFHTKICCRCLLTFDIRITDRIVVRAEALWFQVVLDAALGVMSTLKVPAKVHECSLANTATVWVTRASRLTRTLETIGDVPAARIVTARCPQTFWFRCKNTKVEDYQYSMLKTGWKLKSNPRVWLHFLSLDISITFIVCTFFGSNECR